MLKKLALPGQLLTFRHSFASDGDCSRIKRELLRSVPGHINRQTLENYTHISSKMAQQAMQALDRNPKSIRGLVRPQKYNRKSSTVDEIADL
jgi:integrase